VTIEPVKLSYADKLRLMSPDAKKTIIGWMLAAFAFSIHETLFNLYLLELGFSEDFVGFFLSIQVFVTGAFAIFAGIMVVRLSKKWVMVGTSILFMISYTVLYTTTDITLMLAAQALLGISFALVGVSFQPYTMSVTTEEERVHVFTIRFALFLCASLMGYLIGGFLPTLWTNLGFATDLTSAYRLSLLTGVIPLVLDVFVALSYTTDKPQMKQGSRFLLKNGRFIGKYALAWAVTGLGAGLFLHFYNIYFSEVFSLDSAAIGVLFALNTLALAMGNFVSPELVDRFGKFWPIVVLNLLSVPLLLIQSWSTFLPFVLVGYVGRNLCMNMAWPVMEVFFLEGLEKDEQSTAMGITSTGDSVARGIGLNIGGMLLAGGMFGVPIALAAVVYLTGGLMFYAFFRTSNESS
jgi:MFS family permease